MFINFLKDQLKYLFDKIIAKAYSIHIMTDYSEDDANTN